MRRTVLCSSVATTVPLATMDPSMAGPSTGPGSGPTLIGIRIEPLVGIDAADGPSCASRVAASTVVSPSRPAAASSTRTDADSKTTSTPLVSLTTRSTARNHDTKQLPWARKREATADGTVTSRPACSGAQPGRSASTSSAVRADQALGATLEVPFDPTGIPGSNDSG